MLAGPGMNFLSICNIYSLIFNRYLLNINHMQDTEELQNWKQAVIPLGNLKNGGF